MTDDRNLPSRKTDRRAVDAFLEKVRAAPAPAVGPGTRGRLIFALDATASREPTWDRACHLQGEMFEAAADLGGLEVQLVFYRGFRECKASRWLGDSRRLADTMVKVRCHGGRTQIGRVLDHARKETKVRRVGALIFVGDAFEEDIDLVCDKAGELGLLGVRSFMFHEGDDHVAGRAFSEIARLTGGAYAPFNAASADALREMLAAVAVYAAGGMAALEDFSSRHGTAVRQITHQIGRR